MAIREIEFRGKRVSDGEWIVGNLVINKVDTPMRFYKVYRICDNTYGFTDEEGFEPDFMCGYDEEVVPSTVGQYTGLTDKNGRKIFEGDMLKIAKKMDGMGTYYSPAIEYPVKVVVRWDMCAWLWETITKDKRYITFPDAWCHFEFEVIGNIHDNPELLKGGEG